MLFQDLRTNLKLLNSKLEMYKNDRNIPTNDIIAIMDLTKNLVNNRRYTNSDLKEYMRVKKKYDMLFNFNIHVNEEVRSEYIPPVEFNKLDKIKKIGENINNIVNLNDYIDCVVKTQGEKIDNIMYKMRMEAIKSEGIVDELKNTLSRKKTKTYWKRVFIFILISLVGILIFKSILLRAIGL